MEGDLTEGELCRVLRQDRLSARETVQNLTHSFHVHAGGGTDSSSYRPRLPGDGDLTAEATDVEGPDQGRPAPGRQLLAQPLRHWPGCSRSLRRLPWQLAVVDYVMEQEALFVRTIEQHEEQREKQCQWTCPSS